MRPTAATRYPSPETHLEAARAAFRASLIPTDPDTLPPLAREVLAAGPFGLRDLAESIVEFRMGPGAVRGGDGFNTVISALSTADFPSVVQEVAQAIAQERRSGILADLLAVTAPVEVADYREGAFATVDLGDIPHPSASTASRYYALTPRMAAERVQVFSTFCRLLQSRQVITNDDAGFLPAALAAFALAAHRGELRHLARLLEANAAVEDGTALFHADRGNLTVGALDAGGLAAGFAALRKQPSESGLAACAPCAAIMAHPDDEVGFLRLFEDLPESARPRLVVNPFLASNGAWYAFAPPSDFPTIGRVRLRGSDPSAISVGIPGPAVWEDADGTVHEYPGLAYDVTHSVGYAVLSPVGIVKLSKT